ncbi:hypothetical protein [Dubosiella newyorkensis]|uniref:hypothetical protein n=2 Tax=Dubosiella newyorkensis TaxID=1862672 RepID=UPI0023F31DB4|nr:hypothetical protein [Dubosiella newyorkensis]
MMKRTWNLILSCLALCGILFFTLPQAYAYFTTYVAGRGVKEINLSHETKIEEEIPGPLQKSVTVTLEEGSQPVYVRVLAIAPTNTTLTYTPSQGWSQGNDGYFYYESYLTEQDPSTNPLLIKIEPDQENTPAEFNVVVLSESIPVEFDEDGNALSPNWDKAIQIERGGRS